MKFFLRKSSFPNKCPSLRGGDLQKFFLPFPFHKLQFGVGAFPCVPHRHAMHLSAACPTSKEDLQPAIGIDSSFRLASLSLLPLSNFLFNVPICNGISNDKIGSFKPGHLVETQRNICQWLPSSNAVFGGEGENFSLAPSFPSFGSVPEINDLGSPSLPPTSFPRPPRYVLRYLFPAAHERTLQWSQERIDEQRK